jgi:hypothetical protein
MQDVSVVGRLVRERLTSFAKKPSVVVQSLRYELCTLMQYQLTDEIHVERLTIAFDADE